MDEHQSSKAERTQQAMTYNLVKRMIAMSLVFGLLGGIVSGVIVGRWSNSAVSRQQVVQENSAIINVVKSVSPSVVSITSQSSGNFGLFGLQTNQTAAGTGIIVSADGLIMTNNHVIDGASSLNVYTSDGKIYKNAKVVATDAARDIAFIRVTANGLKPAPLGDSSNLQVGQGVVAIGNALGQFQNSATQGIISGLGRPVTAGDSSSGGNVESLDNLIQTDAAINPGNSGGPLVNLDGQVIGMNTAIAGQAQNIGFAIPINQVKAALDSVKSQGKITRPYLGVRYVDITPDYASNNNLSVNYGAYISGDQSNPAIVPGSPAEKAGLQAADIITKVDNDTIDSTHSLATLVGKHKVGDKVKLTYLRGGKQQTVDVTLAQAPTS